MVYLQNKMVNSKLQKRSLFHFFFESVTLRILQMFGNPNPNPNPLLNLPLLAEAACFLNRERIKCSLQFTLLLQFLTFILLPFCQ